EKNSIDPFVAQGAGGTYVAMADGSVRFVKKTINEKVFQQMCVVDGEKLDEKMLDEYAPLEKKTAEMKPAPVPEPEKKDPPVEKSPPIKVEPKPPVEKPKEEAKLPPGWKEFVAAEGFTIAFPGTPQTIKQPLPAEAGGGTLNVSVLLDKETGFAYTAGAAP